MKKERYRGAGILFLVNDGNNLKILLSKRRQTCLWSIPGGKQDSRDSDYWDTAVRETCEEFKGLCLTPNRSTRSHCTGKTRFWPSRHPQNNTEGLIQYEQIFVFSYPFYYFNWKTYVVKLSEKPSVKEFPDKDAYGFQIEFCDAKWFSIDRMPFLMHPLLLPIIWRLRLSR